MKNIEKLSKQQAMQVEARILIGGTIRKLIVTDTLTLVDADPFCNNYAITGPEWYEFRETPLVERKCPRCGERTSLIGEETKHGVMTVCVNCAYDIHELEVEGNNPFAYEGQCYDCGMPGMTDVNNMCKNCVTGEMEDSIEYGDGQEWTGDKVHEEYSGPVMIERIEEDLPF